MVLVDNRIGSKDLIPHLEHWQIPCQLSTLEYGDAAFVGCGPTEDGGMLIGVEIKAVSDALQCMDDGRFAGHQLPGLVQTYGRVWLVVEGAYSVQQSSARLTMVRQGARSKLAGHGDRKHNYSGLTNWLTTMEECGGVRVRQTVNRAETAAFIGCLYHWWSKPYDRHHAHQAIHKSAQPSGMVLTKPSLLRRIASELPGIGWTRSGAVAQHFQTVERMMAASELEWMEVEGVGKTVAKSVFESLRKK
jgi:ERCC4-type nuclease